MSKCEWWAGLDVSTCPSNRTDSRHFIAVFETAHASAFFTLQWYWDTLRAVIGGSCHKNNFGFNKKIGVTKHVFYRDKSMLATTKRLSRENILVTTKDRYLSQQTRVCHDKHTFVATKDVFRCNKSKLVATKHFSRPKYVCHDKLTSVATKHISCLSRQK